LGDKLKLLGPVETGNQLPKTQIPVRLFPPHLNPTGTGHSASAGSFCPPKCICGVLSALAEMLRPQPRILLSPEWACFWARPGSVWGGVATRGRSSPAFAHSRRLTGWSRRVGDISYHLFHFMLFLDTWPYSPEDLTFCFEVLLLAPAHWRTHPMGSCLLLPT